MPLLNALDELSSETAFRGLSALDSNLHSKCLVVLAQLKDYGQMPHDVYRRFKKLTKKTCRWQNKRKIPAHSRALIRVLVGVPGLRCTYLCNAAGKELNYSSF